MASLSPDCTQHVVHRSDNQCLSLTLAGARLLTKQARGVSFAQRRSAVSRLHNVMSPTQDPRSSDPSSGPSGQPESQAPPGTTKDMEQAPDHGEKSYKGTGETLLYVAAHSCASNAAKQRS
jgi:hypothetical protein